MNHIQKACLKIIVLRSVNKATSMVFEFRVGTRLVYKWLTSAIFWQDRVAFAFISATLLLGVHQGSKKPYVSVRINSYIVSIIERKTYVIHFLNN